MQPVTSFAMTKHVVETEGHALTALNLVTLVSPKVKASVALGDSHVCWSKPHSSTLPPLANSFSKVTSQAESGEEREMNTVLPEQAAM